MYLKKILLKAEEIKVKLETENEKQCEILREE